MQVEFEKQKETTDVAAGQEIVKDQYVIDHMAPKAEV